MMKRKWVLAIAILGLFLSSDLLAQYTPNELMMQAGPGYWMGTGGPWGYPNHGLAKYYPSYLHWAGTKLNGFFPTKVDGWGWSAMQANINSTVWFFSSSLQRIMDYPYDTVILHNFIDFPKLYCNGTIIHSGWPNWMWGGLIPAAVPGLGGTHGFVFPSSYGGLDNYWNIFAVTTGSVITPPPGAWYIWIFSLAGDCTAPLTVPSSHSIYEYVWNNRPQCQGNQYMLISGDEYDSTGTASQWVGLKSKCHTWMGDYDHGLYWGWPNNCSGAGIEAGYGIFMCDVVTIPVNVPGNPYGINVYSAKGFDQGSPCQTPLASTGTAKLRFMSLANQAPGVLRGILGALQYPPDYTTTPWNWNNQSLPYGPGQMRRVPHKWDLITNIFINVSFVFTHTPAAGYPSWFFTSCVGADTIGLPLPVNPFLLCLELHFSSFAPGQAPSAGFMATYF